jgi:putative heme iron utilization protein
VSQHAGPPGVDVPSVPEPTFAERARTLVSQVRTGMLATLSRKHRAHPVASLMPYALDPDGRPLLLISTMAVHTQNLLADPRASLLVTQPDVSGEPLAGGRVTLMGEAKALGAEAAAPARAAYLARHPVAESWVDFGDFGFWRLEVLDVYFVGGFAAMGWVEAAQYGAARPDPLIDVAAGILEHMNRDHADALRVYAAFFAKAESDEASMTAVDRLGFKLRLRQGPRRWSARVAFPREVTTAADARAVLIEMLREARSAAS